MKLFSFPVTKDSSFGSFTPREVKKVPKEHTASEPPPPTRATITSPGLQVFLLHFCTRVPEPPFSPIPRPPSLLAADICAALCLLVSKSSSFSWLPISLPNCKILVQNIKPDNLGSARATPKSISSLGCASLRGTLLKLREVRPPQRSCIIMKNEHHLPNLCVCLSRSVRPDSLRPHRL